MKIAFDAQLLFEQQKTGVGWNSKMIIDEAIELPGNNYHLNLFVFKNYQEKMRILAPYFERECEISACRWFPAAVYNRISRIFPLPYSFFVKGKNDITIFFNFIIPPGVKGKRAVFIHDMTYKAFPETVNQKTRRWLEKNLEKSCLRADVIFTVSEFSKQEIHKYLGVELGKIHVIYNGVDLHNYYVGHSAMELEAVRKRYKLRGSYLLYLGTLEPRKNIKLLIESYHLLTERMENHPLLVLAGKPGWMYDEIFRKVQEYNLTDKVIFTGYVAQEDAPALMEGAEIFLFPSIYEGFGMPPLEAMACGTPVIVSNAASLPEIVSDAAVQVPPNDVEGMTEAMRYLLLNPGIREEYIQKGMTRAGEFTWSHEVEKMIQILELVTLED